ncbi:MAG: amino acid adenylation domain-containing protein [Acidimicrobiales bacterium]|nr:amino acid adenylation domain-containing protein [Acidimicrobiales bacterium]
MTAEAPLLDALRSAAPGPAAPAIRERDRPPIHWAALLDVVAGWTAALRAAGLGEDDRVILLQPDGAPAATAVLAVTNACTCVPVHERTPLPEIEALARRVGATAVLAFSATAAPAASALGLPALLARTASVGSFELEVPGPIGHGRSTDDDGGGRLVLRTSGTTGEPRLVALDHGNLLAAARAWVDALGLTPADACLTSTPFTHAHAIVPAVLAGLLAGGSVVCGPEFDPANWLETAETERPTWAQAVPSLWQTLVAHLDQRPDVAPVHHLRFLRSGGAALAEPTRHALEERLGVPVLISYGLSESAGFATCTPAHGRRVPGTVGLAHGCEVAVHAADGQALPPGTEGEIVVRGPNVMAGYLDDPDATAEVLRDGWLRTGDLGRLDADGYLTVVGRMKEIINRGGESLAPAEIEAALVAHPAVRDAVAFPVPDRRLGEQVGAAVVLVEGAATTELGLREHVAGLLAPSKVPRRIAVVEHLERTPTGKPRRAGLPELLGFHDLDDVPDDGPRPMRDSGSARGRADAALRRRRARGRAPRHREVATESRPLTPAQEGIWLEHAIVGSGQARVSVGGARLTGPLDPTALARAVGRLVERHEPLRTVFPLVEGEPRQVVLPPPETAPFEVRSCPGVPAHDRAAIARRAAQVEAARAVDPTVERTFRVVLLAFADDDHALLWSVHHLAFDGWSHRVLARDLLALYEAERTGAEPDLPELTITAGEWAAENVHRWHAGADERLARRVAALAPVPRLTMPVDPDLAATAEGAAPPLLRTAPEPVDAHLPAPAVEHLRAVGARADTTLFGALLGAFAAVIGDAAGQPAVTVSVPVAGRESATSDLVGCFIDTVFVPVHLPDEPSLDALAGATRGPLLEAMSEPVPRSRLVAALRSRRSSRFEPLARVAFQLRDWDHAPITPTTDGLRVASVPVPQPVSTMVWLSALAEPDGRGGLRISVTYDDHRFTRTTVQRWVEQWVGLLTGEPARPVHRRAAGFLPGEATPPETVARHAAATPDRVAIDTLDGPLRWADLHREANRVAHHLLDRGIGHGSRVLVHLATARRGAPVPLGVLSAGAAYVPVEPTQPPARLAQLCDRAAVAAVITDCPLPTELAAAADRAGVPVLAAAAVAAAGPDTPPPVRLHADDPAYVIFTSGSTGPPKGVVVHHGALAAFLSGLVSRCGLGPDDRLLYPDSLAFDASVIRVFGTMRAGGASVEAPNALLRPPLEYLRLLADREITVASIPTALWHELVLGLGDDPPPLPPGLHTVRIGGEAARPDVLERWQTLFGDRVRLINGYGPTETTVNASDAELTYERPAPGRPVPIGTPYPAVAFHVLDESGAPVPAGEVGELYLTGRQVATGYLLDPDTTAARFVTIDIAGLPTRAYRTGDRVRRRADGAYEFHGRVDQQVKIAGHRVEPAEVEAALTSLPGVAEAVVTVRHDPASTPELVGVLVPEPGAELDPAAVRRSLAEALPEAHVPKRLLVRDTMPRTPGGKADRVMLAAEVAAPGRADRHGSSPGRSPLEALAAWATTQPHAVAVDDGTVTTTWAELLQQSRRVANHLRSRGVGRGDRVAVHLGADRNLVPVLFGVLFAGAAFAPLDPDAPSARNADLIGRCRPFALVGRRGEQLPFDGAVLDAATMVATGADHDPGVVPRDDDPAYVMFTSGSTGHPKGVVVPHRALAAYCRAFVESAGWTPDDRVLQLHSAAFDRVIEEVFAAAEAGATIVVRPEDVMGSPGAMRSALSRLRVTVHELPTAYWHALTESGFVPPPCVRMVRIGGEAARLDTLEAWQLSVGPHVILRNGYGPTEATVTVTHADLTHEQPLSGQPLPIGHPLPTAELHVLDADGNPVPDGLAGELYVTGVQLALGYLDDPDATARAFPTIDVGSGPVRAYRTGDRVRRRPDGALEFLGRIDSQVKIQGNRVEPAEVETALRALPGVADAAVVAVTGATGDLELAAAVVPRPGHHLDPRILRSTLGERMPGPFVPRHLDVRASLPRTSGGKADRARLRQELSPAPAGGATGAASAPGARHGRSTGTHERPSGEAFDTVAAAWRDVLDRDRVDPDEDFFAAGGDSLLAVRLLARLERELGVSLPVSALLDAPTVRGLAALVGPDDARPSTRPPGSPRSPLDALAAWATVRPDAVAVDDGTVTVTWADLLQQARRVANHLRSSGIGRGDRVAVHLGADRNLVPVLFGILAAGAAYVALDPDAPPARNAGLLARCRPAALVGDGCAEPAFGGPVLDAATLVGTGPDHDPGIAPGDDDPAYVMFTSGSTGHPKGVVIPHRALAAYCPTYVESAGWTPDDRVLQLHSAAFDCSIQELFCAAEAGATIVIRPADALGSPSAVSDVLDRLRITVFDVPTAYWHALVDGGFVPPPCVRMVAIGGEAARPEVLDTWQRTVRHGVILRNGYGPTETTVTVAHADLTHERLVPGQPLPIGHPHATAELHLLDERGVPVPDGEAGEIHVTGVQLALGYLDDPEATARAFPTIDVGSGPVRAYRTGDRARRRPDGALEFLGRIDAQVKVQGNRVEPAEVETALRALPGVADAAVVAVTDAAGDLELAAAVVARPGHRLDPHALRAALGERMPGPFVPSRIAIRSSLPRTPGGKADRTRLRQELGRAPVSQHPGSERAGAPDELTPVVRQVWAELLGVDDVVDDVTFFDLGGHSLLALRLLAAVEDRTGVALPLAAMLDDPTVAGMVRTVHRRRASMISPAAPAPPLHATPQATDSPPADAAATATTVPEALRVWAGRRPDHLALTAPGRPPVTWRDLVDGAEGLGRDLAARGIGAGDRVAVVLPDGPELAAGVLGAMCAAVATPVPSETPLDELERVLRQRACRALVVGWGSRALATMAVAGRLGLAVVRTVPPGSARSGATGEPVPAARATRPDDVALLLPTSGSTATPRLVPLTHANLLAAARARAERLAIGPDDRALVLSPLRFEHGVVTGLVTALVAGGSASCPGLGSPAAARRWLDAEQPTWAVGIPALWAGVLDRVRGEPASPPPSALRFCYSGAAALPPAVASGLEAVLGVPVVEGYGLTEAGGLVTCSSPAERRPGTVGRAAGCEVVIVDDHGTPLPAGAAGRVAVRGPAVMAGYADAAAEGPSPIRDGWLHTNDVGVLDADGFLRLLGRLDDVVNRAGELIGPAEVEAVLLEHPAVLDVAVVGVPDPEVGHDLAAAVVRRPGHALDAEELRAFARSRTLPSRVPRRIEVLDALPRTPGGKVARPQLVERLAGGEPAPLDAVAHWATVKPAAVAVDDGDVTVTWVELLRQVRRVANHLADRGVGRGDRVAVHIGPDRTLVPALLGILAAGAAYVPLDPDAPSARTADLLQRCRPSAVLTDRPLDHPSAIPVLDIAALVAAGCDDPLDVSADPDDPAYVIYTSGSTGNPKGAVISRRALEIYLPALEERNGWRPDDRILQFHSAAFDTSVHEVFGTVHIGATIVVRPPDALASPRGLAAALERLGVTVAHLPTAYWHELVRGGFEPPACLHQLQIGGEQARPEALEAWQRTVGDRVRLVNGYGPTETTVSVSWADLTREPVVPGRPLPIGHALPTAGLHVLDAARRPVPDGEMGELYVTGPHLAIGYLDDPEATAAAFSTIDAGAGPVRAYRTGDRVRRRADGALEFHGRVDSQVKIRGHRIEPAEVEAALRAVGGVAEAVVVTPTDPSGVPELAAVVVPDPGRHVEAAQVRSAMAERLPAPFVPKRIEVWSSLPRTSGLKADRARLRDELSDPRSRSDAPARRHDTIGTAIRAHARRTPGEPAILTPGRPPLTWAGLVTKIDLLASMLRASGVGRADVVAVVLPDGPEAAVCMVATATVAACAPLSADAPAPELVRSLRRLGAKAVIGAADAPTVWDAAAEAGLPGIEVHADLDRPAGAVRLEPRPVADVVDLRDDVEPWPDDVCLVLPTSGSLGEPKLVPLSHRNVLTAVLDRGAVQGLGRGDRALVVTPLVRVQGLVTVLLNALVHGGSVVCTPDRSAAAVMAAIADLQPTWFTAVPASVNGILEQLMSGGRPRHTLRFVGIGGATSDPTLADDLRDRLGVAVVLDYGLTECAGVATSASVRDGGSEGSHVGFPSGTDVRVVDGEGRPVPAGGQGEIELRGPHLFAGYLDDPDATAAAFRDGWFRTGDLGVFDEAGRLRLVGRTREMIKRGGEAIAPVEVEVALREHPAVDDERLAPTKVPRRVVLTDDATTEAPRTIGDLLEAAIRRVPDAPALRVLGRPPLRYRDVGALLRETEHQLRIHGIGPTDRVAVMLPDGPVQAAVLLGVMAAAIAHAIAPDQPDTALVQALARFRPRAAIIAVGDVVARRAAETAGAVVLEVDETPPPGAPGVATWQGPADRPAAAASGRPGPTDVAVAASTSATTGTPKLVALTHRNLLVGLDVLRDLDANRGERRLAVQSLARGYGLGSYIRTLARQGEVLCCAGATAHEVRVLIEHERPTRLSLPPSLAQGLLAVLEQDPLPADHDLRMVSVAGAGVSEEFRTRLEAALGRPVRNSYGMTEAAWAGVRNRPEAHKPGTVGCIHDAAVEVLVVDTHGAEVPAGETGEVVARGPSVMAGYLDDPEATAAAFLPGGWLRTGDLGHLDADGYLTITGRLREMINRGGAVIPPAEIDAVLMAHPDVTDAVAFAVPDRRLGEQVAAAVVLRPGATTTERDLRLWCAERLRPDKVPRRIAFTDHLPTGPSGKHPRRGLAERFGLRDLDDTPTDTGDLTTIGGLLRGIARAAPDAPALRDPGRPPMRWRDLAGLLDTTEAALRSRGVGPHGRVAVVLPDGATQVAVLFATISAALAHPVAVDQPGPAIERALRRFRPQAVIVASTDEPTASVAEHLGAVVLRIEPTTDGAPGVARWHGPEPVPDARPADAGPTATDLALAVATSATTGEAKLVALTHRNLVRRGRAWAAPFGHTAADRMLATRSLARGFGIGGVLSTIATGGEVICAAGATPPEALALVSRERPTRLTLPPAVAQSLLAWIRLHPGDLGPHDVRLTVIAGAAVAEEVRSGLEAVLGTPVVEGYGLSETTWLVVSNTPSHRRAGTAGATSPAAEVAVVDDDGRAVGAGSIGEIVVRGDVVMAGYLDDPDATAAAFLPGGWLRTGDLGSVDGDGFLRITGRVREMINRGGATIAPAEIDDVLLHHPDVLEAAAFPVPDRRLGEQVGAAVVLRPGSTVTERELRAFVADRLASDKVPRRIVVTDRLPVEPSGKVARCRLAEHVGVALLDETGCDPAAPTPETTIGERLSGLAEAQPDALALMTAGGATWSWRAFVAEVDALGARLRRQGVGGHDRVAVALPDGPELLVAVLGAASVAAAVVLDPVEPAMVDLARRAGACMAVVADGDGGIATMPLTGTATGETPPGVAVVLPTSGTTAVPRLVALTHANLLGTAATWGATLGLDVDDRYLSIAPLTRAQGLVSALQSLLNGGSVAWPATPAAPDVVDALANLGATWTTAVPAAWRAIVDQLERPGRHRRAPRLRHVHTAGAPMDDDLRQRLEAALGVPVLDAYGLTETSGRVAGTLPPPGERPPGTVGRPVPPIEVAILDEAGAPVPAGVAGEIVVRGPTVAAGYLDDAAATAARFRDGWFHTGDTGVLQADGALSVAGRLDEVISRGGETIAPVEVEAALAAHPAVLEAVAFAVPDRRLGEQVAAAVILRPDADPAPTERDLRAHAADRLAPPKVPRRVLLVDDLPRTATGKPRRVGLAEHVGLAHLDETPAPPAGGDTLAEVIRAQAAARPHAPFLIDPGRPPLTWGGMGVQLDRVTTALRRAEVGPRDRVAVLLPSGADLAATLLAVAASAAAAPLDPGLPPAALERLLRRLGVRAAVVTDPTAPAGRTADDLGLPLVVLTTDPADVPGPVAVEVSGAAPSTPAAGDGPDPDDVALLKPTSATTGEPKWVPMTHRGLLVSARRSVADLGLTADDRMLHVRSLAQGQGSAGLLRTVVAGGQLVAAPAASPADVLRQLGEEQPTWMNMAPAMWQAVLDRVRDHPGELPAHRLRFVLSTGAALAAPVAAELERALGVPVLDAYGLSETSNTPVTANLPGDRRAGTVGRCRVGELVVVDETGRPVPAGTVGEIAVRGPTVVSGYLDDPEATAAAFRDGWFRTGDLGRLDGDGYLTLVGRERELIDRGGAPVAPAEVDDALLTHPAVAAAVTFAVPDRRLGEQVAAAVVLRPDAAPTPTERELRAYAAERLAPHQVPRRIVITDHLATGPSGKVARRGLAEHFGLADLDDAGPARRPPAEPSGLEAQLTRVWCDVLRLDQVGLHERFLDVGGDSLTAGRVIARVRDELGLDLPLIDFFDHPTVATQAELLRRAGPVGASGPGPAAAPTRAGRPGPARLHLDRAPLSFAQERLWFLHRLRPDSSEYNLVTGVELRGAVDAEALAGALADLAATHEPLRTRIRSHDDGVPYQLVDPVGPVELARVDLTAMAPSARDAALDALAERERRRPFDLAEAWPWRPTLVRVDDDLHVVLLVIHHVAWDGESGQRLPTVLAAAYAARTGTGPAPTGPPFTATDLAVWQRARLAEGAFHPSLAWWRARLDLLPEPLQLRQGGPGTPPPPDEGGVVRRPLDAAERDALASLARRCQATPFATGLAALAATLWRWTGRGDLVVGIPHDERTRLGAEGMLGFLVNSLPVRIDLSDRPTMRTLVHRVQRGVFEAIDHADAPFDLIVDAVNPVRDPSSTPVFQVMYTVGHGRPQTHRAGAVELAPRRVTSHTGRARFDLLALVNGDHTELTIDHRLSVMDAEAAEAFADQLVRLLVEAAADPDGSIASFDLLDPADRRWLTAGPTSPVDGPWRHRPLPEIVGEQVRARPDAVAVEDGDTVLRYAELLRRAEHLAGLLTAAGVRPGDAVGLELERSAAMVVAMLATLLTGAAYVPLDPEYPQARRELIAAEARLRVVVRAGAGGDVTLSPGPGAGRDTSIPPAAEPALAPAYVMFTSGSTGRPKGVVVPHRAIARLAIDTDYVQLGPDDVVAHASSTAFDASTFEVWGALLTGARLVVIDRETLLDPNRLPDALRRHGITTLWLTSRLFDVLARARPDSFATLRHLLVGGEPVDPDTVRTVRRAGPPGRLLNGYGPTETTTFASWYLIDEPAPGATSIPIGHPIAHTTLHVLDAAGEPLPAGVTGELFVGGDGVALGYLGDPALTAERFGPDPLSADPAARRYRTGDLVRRRGDGALEFVGRRDRQVKLRGVRIELGEIEAALREIVGVADAVVTMVGADEGAHLVGYVVPGPSPAEPGAERPLVDRVRDELVARLPAILVPSAIVVLDALPLTPNGKVDRTALPAPAARPSRGESDDPLVERVLGLLRAAVRDPGAGPDDDFFDLGGNSLLAVRLLASIERDTGTAVPLHALLEHTTARALARSVREHTAGPAGPAPAEVPSGAGPLQRARVGRASLRGRDVGRVLVPIRTTGSRPPLVLIHGADGGVLGFGRVARELGDDQPVYAIQEVSWMGAGSLSEGVEDLARRYADVVQEHLPARPLVVAGLSYGGLVAFELARVLHDRGRTPLLLALIEATPPRATGEAEPGVVKVPISRREGLRRLPGRVRRFASAIPVWWWEARAGREPSIRAAGDRGIVKARLGVARYRPQPYPGATVFLRAADAGPRTSEVFGALVLGPYEVVRVPGTHTLWGDGLLAGDNAPHAAAAIAAAIDAATRR